MAGSGSICAAAGFAAVVPHHLPKFSAAAATQPGEWRKPWDSMEDRHHLMDLTKPVLDGVEATRQIMAKSPCAILVVTAHPDTQSTKVFEAMGGAGALDVTSTPDLGTDPGSGTMLLAKIETIGKLVGSNSESRAPANKRWHLSPSSLPLQLVAIGASADRLDSTTLGHIPYPRDYAYRPSVNAFF
jgi:CheY-like chemotaxis protein